MSMSLCASSNQSMMFVLLVANMCSAWASAMARCCSSTDEHERNGALLGICFA